MPLADTHHRNPTDFAEVEPNVAADEPSCEPGTPRRCGAVGLAGGAVRWRVWAPHARRVDLVLIDPAGARRALAMRTDGDGYFHHREADVPEGQRYAYRLDGSTEYPDPCSLWQPEGVLGPSAVVRPCRFTWTAGEWQGIDRRDLVFYELHVGTFTPEGTFDAVIPHLPHLRDLGITALEIMPVGQFPGQRNWGYDGVLPYAVQDSYGGPHGLQRLVDACHREGLAIFLDVVYNHVGPEGNYLAKFGPYFTDHYRTPWGQAVNFDNRGCDPVRDYVVNNVRLWLEEYQFDGLRLDAVHAIYDLGARHILREMREIADAVSARVGRPVYLIAESDLNDPRLLLPPSRGGFGLDGQWADDFHHAVHAALTGERHGYYADFGSRAQLAQVMEGPYLYAGSYSQARGRKHGAPLPPEIGGDCFVVCLQNHDQVGNRARGDRLTRLLSSPAQRRLAVSLLFFSPYLPLLFMGEEYGEENPFPFFCSFSDPQLIANVRVGRKREFTEFYWQGEVPDPQDVATFEMARLNGTWTDQPAAVILRRLYRDLLAARRTWPALRDFSNRRARLRPDAERGPLLELTRGTNGATVRILFNLDGQPHFVQEGPGAGEAVLFRSEATGYGGTGGSDPRGLLPYECVVIGPNHWPMYAGRSTDRPVVARSAGGENA